MTAVATVIAALLIVLAAALWLELRAERQAAARVLASYLLDAAARDDPPASLGWGPGGLVRLPPRVAFRECGCLEFEGGVWSQCLEHDPAFEPPVDQWAREMGDL